MLIATWAGATDTLLTNATVRAETASDINRGIISPSSMKLDHPDNLRVVCLAITFHLSRLIGHTSLSLP